MTTIFMTYPPSKPEAQRLVQIVKRRQGRMVGGSEGIRTIAGQDSRPWQRSAGCREIARSAIAPSGQNLKRKWQVAGFADLPGSGHSQNANQTLTPTESWRLL
jgi:hypothetical protein